MIILLAAIFYKVTAVAFQKIQDVDEIDRLSGTVEQFEKQLTGEEEDVENPLVKDVETPTQEPIDRYDATHTPYKRWCRHCNDGLAVGGQHRDKEHKKMNKHEEYHDEEVR